MAVDLRAVVIDSSSPMALARFWARALGWEVGDAGPDVIEVVPTDSTTFHLEIGSGAATKVGQNPIHFDLTTTSIDDQESTVAHLIAHGATPADVGQAGDEGHVVLADPEGNELCVIEPGNRFLASCPRLGAVNCDGTAELGRFFSAILGWPLVWDQDSETAIQSPTGDGPKITWSGPPLMPKSRRERIHLHLAPAAGSSVDDAVAELLLHGATSLADPGHRCADAVSLADLDGNELCVIGPVGQLGA